jgi:hypothetical protein
VDAVAERPRTAPPRDPWSPAPAPPPAPAATIAAPLAGLCCPQCQSEHVHRLPLVLGGGVVATSAATWSARRTLASLGAAPPKRRGFSAPLILAAIAFLFLLAAGLAGLPMGAVLLAAAAAWIHAGVSHNRTVHPQLRAEWESSFLCHRCAHVFNPS